MKKKQRTYVLLGPKGEKHPGCLRRKRGSKAELKRHPDREIKKEFKAPSWNVARVVYELAMGDGGNFWDDTIDQFIHDLADYFGYAVDKKPVVHQKKQKKAAGKP